MVEHGNILLVISGILTASLASQWIAWRIKLPAIIFLLFSGILAGPVLGLLNPTLLLGDLFFPFVSLCVAIILFEGSLTLKFHEILGLESVVRNMVSFGMLVTWLITAVAAKYTIGLSWNIAFLFGAITVVSGPTVIVPMLRTIRPTASISNILRWEGIVIDPIGATLAILVYEFIISGGGNPAIGHTFITFGKLMSVGIITGLLAGYLFGIIIRNHWLPEYLQNISSITFVLVTFIAANLIQPESGLVTVTVMGIFLANMKRVHMDEILDFKENISIILISVLFILLAARIDLYAMKALGWRVILLFIAIQFLARPLNIMISAKGSKLTWPERHMLAWIAPRGIVAAAISALFSVQLEKAGFTDAALLVPLTFFVIIGTVLLQSITARPIARILKVAEPEPMGFLIIGANLAARKIAKALIQNKINVMLTDTGWDHISKARNEGLPTYFGNFISEHAERHLDLIGIGHVIALSPHENVNAAAVMHYQMEVGRNKVFTIQSKPNEDTPERYRLSAQRQGKKLFGKNITYTYLTSVLLQNGIIRTTALTEHFSFENFLEKHQGRATPLFAINKKGRVHVFTEGEAIEPQPKWSLIYLLNETPSTKTD